MNGKTKSAKSVNGSYETAFLSTHKQTRLKPTRTVNVFGSVRFSRRFGVFRRGRRLRTTGPQRRVGNMRVRVQRVFGGRRQERDGENKERRTAGEVRLRSRGRVVHDTNRSEIAIVANHAPRKTPNSINFFNSLTARKLYSYGSKPTCHSSLSFKVSTTQTPSRPFTGTASPVYTLAYRQLTIPSALAFARHSKRPSQCLRSAGRCIQLPL